MKTMSAIARETAANDEDWNAPHERQRKRKRKSDGSMMVLVVGWTVVMGGIVLVANRCWKGDERQTAWIPPQAGERLTSEDHDLIRQHAATCQNVINNVLSHNTPEHITPFVFNQHETFSDMVRYYRMNQGTQILDAKIESQGFSVIQLPDGPAIEGRWRTGDGRLIDAVFRQEGDDWLLDWHHFARYSEFPWALFLAGDGPEEAEFRLLARQRLVRQVLDEEGRPMSLVFHAPRFGRPGDSGPPSPVFELDWDSEAARLLVAGFTQTREGRRPFRALLPNAELDEDMMRVRVVVRRIDGENDRRFEIVEVRACHWLQVDDPGVSLEDSESNGSQ